MDPPKPEPEEVARAYMVITKHRAIYSKPGELRQFVQFKSVRQTEARVVTLPESKVSQLMAEV
jgi:hypothetical protein